MIPAYIQQWLYTQLEQLHYTNVRQCFVDVCQALDAAPWLSPRAETLRATGRVLISLQGRIESHQVEIWVAAAYPQEASHVYVDAQPRRVSPGLSVSGLLHVATQPPPTPPPKPTKPAKPAKAAAPATPATPAKAPAVPQKPPKLPAKPPAGARSPPPPPKGAVAPNAASQSRLATPVQSSRPASLPPLPAKEGPASRGSPAPPHAPPPTEDYPVHRVLHGALSHNASPGYAARAVASPAPAPAPASQPRTFQPPVPQASTVASPQAPFVPTQSPTSQPSAPQQASPPRPPSAPQSPAPAIDLLSITDAAPRAVSGERAETLARLERALQAQAAGLFYQSQVDAQQLAASSHALAQIEAALAREKDSLLRTKDALLRNTDVLEQSASRAEELTRRAAAHAPPASIADLVQVTASDRAVVEADSSSRAIDDLLRVLPKALDAGSISLHVYLRLVRQYAREQFSHRHALLQRKPQPPKPPAKH